MFLSGRNQTLLYPSLFPFLFITIGCYYAIYFHISAAWPHVSSCHSGESHEFTRFFTNHRERKIETSLGEVSIYDNNSSNNNKKKVTKQKFWALSELNKKGNLISTKRSCVLAFVCICLFVFLFSFTRYECLSVCRFLFVCVNLTVYRKHVFI